MPKTKKLTKKEVEFFRKILIILRDKIVGNIQGIEGNVLNKSQKDSSGDLSGYAFHMADVASDNYDTELSLEFAGKEQQILNEIDDALKRIENGSYGLCEKYGTAIPKKRLEVMPYARYCIKAQQEIEKEQKM